MSYLHAKFDGKTVLNVEIQLSVNERKRSKHVKDGRNDVCSMFVLKFWGKTEVFLHFFIIMCTSCTVLPARKGTRI